MNEKYPHTHVHRIRLLLKKTYLSDKDPEQY